jgi:hypothetical protein
LQAQEALLRRALQQTPAAPADATAVDDDTLTALRALRCRVIACQASVPHLSRLHAPIA